MKDVSVPEVGSADGETAGILHRTYRWVTLGSVALVFLSAFESLAVTTVMPAVSADLGGESLYALAFAGPLAAGVIGMVGAGSWADRSGPVAPMYACVALFVVGLLVAGLALSMPVFLLGRLVQGLGGGGVTVALYVVVARAFPPPLHAKIFAAFAAAWVVPSLVGPFVAGAVSDLFGWHWVFLGVVALILAASVMVVPTLRGIDDSGDASARFPVGRLAWAVLAAASVLVVNLSGSLPGAGWVLSIAAAVVVVVAVRPLLPRGALRLRRGLPAVIGLRGLAAAAYFGAEVYLPYMFTDVYRFEATLSGLSLTVAAVTWAVASSVQGRIGERLGHVAFTRLGTVLVLVAIASALATAALGLHPAVAIAGWAVGGAGMGLMYPRLSVALIEYSVPANQGFNSSALSIADSLGGALSLALTGIVASLAGAAGGASSFVGVFAFTAVIAVVAVATASRVAPADGSARMDG